MLETKRLTLLATLFFVMLLSIQPVYAESVYSLTKTIDSSGYQDSQNWVYVQLATNASTGQINLTANVDTRTVWITIVNITKIELDVKAVMAAYNIDSLWALRFANKITLQVTVTGVAETKIILKGVPSVIGIQKDGATFSSWNYTENTLTITLTDGDPELIINFSSIIDTMLTLTGSIIMILAIFAVLHMLWNWLGEETVLLKS